MLPSNVYSMSPRIGLNALTECIPEELLPTKSADPKHKTVCLSTHDMSTVCLHIIFITYRITANRLQKIYSWALPVLSIVLRKNKLI